MLGQPAEPPSFLCNAGSSTVLAGRHFDTEIHPFRSSKRSRNEDSLKKTWVLKQENVRPRPHNFDADIRPGAACVSQRAQDQNNSVVDFGFDTGSFNLYLMAPRIIRRERTFLMSTPPSANCMLVEGPLVKYRRGPNH